MQKILVGLFCMIYWLPTFAGKDFVTLLKDTKETFTLTYQICTLNGNEPLCDPKKTYQLRDPEVIFPLENWAFCVKVLSATVRNSVGKKIAEGSFDDEECKGLSYGSLLFRIEGFNVKCERKS